MATCSARPKTVARERKRETSDPRDNVSASVPVGRGYPELCRGAVRDWPALRAWTRDPHDASGVTYPRLRELVGDREVRAMVGSERGRFDGAPTRHESVRITVSAFLDGACSEEPPNTTGVSPLCLAQIPVYDASASAAEAAETTISSAEKLGAKPLTKAPRFSKRCGTRATSGRSRAST